MAMNVAVHSLVRKSLLDRLDADLLDLGSRRNGRGLDLGVRRGPARPATATASEPVPVTAPGEVPIAARGRGRNERNEYGQVYVERRDETGRRIGTPVMFGVDESTVDVSLDLPDVLEVPRNGPKFFNATAVGNERFRAVARMTPTGQPAFLVTAISAREQDSTLRQLLMIQIGATLGVLGALGAVAWAMTQWLLRPLKRIENSAAAIAGGALDHPIADVNPRTEIGRLGSTLNTMMARIRSSFADEQEAQAKLRRFLADASHELRTPLTAVQGYAQLHQRTRSGVDPETDKMIDRIGGAGARMGSLVEDLLCSHVVKRSWIRKNRSRCQWFLLQFLMRLGLCRLTVRLRCCLPMALTQLKPLLWGTHPGFIGPFPTW
jgi:two-component system, OmpR family, sensor kinase